MCSKLYADGELAATPYETDKVLRHRELCMGLNVLYAKKNHDYGDSFHQTYIEEGMAMPRIRLGDKFSDLLLMLSVVNFQHSHDGIICKVKQGITNRLICHSLLIAVRGENAGERLKTAEQKTCDEGASNAD